MMVMRSQHSEKLGDTVTDNHSRPDLSILSSVWAAALLSLFVLDPKATPISDLQQLTCRLVGNIHSAFIDTYASAELKVGRSRIPSSQTKSKYGVAI